MIGKLVKVDREFTVTKCDNGFMLAVNGRTENDDWSNAKFICSNVDGLVDYINEISKTEVSD